MRNILLHDKPNSTLFPGIIEGVIASCDGQTLDGLEMMYHQHGSTTIPHHYEESNVKPSEPKRATSTVVKAWDHLSSQSTSSAASIDEHTIIAKKNVSSNLAKAPRKFHMLRKTFLIICRNSAGSSRTRVTFQILPERRHFNTQQNKQFRISRRQSTLDLNKDNNVSWNTSTRNSFEELSS